MKTLDLEGLEASLAPYRARSNREIEALLDVYEATRGSPSHPSLRTLAASRRLLLAGKRYRYAIACLTYQGLTGSADFDLPARPATWLELYHLYTLFLDDVMDEDERRRTFPSAWKANMSLYRAKDAEAEARLFRTVRHRYGGSMAILDALRIRSLAERVIQASALDASVQEQILEILTDADLQLSDGQGLDIDFERADRVEQGEYERMSDLKTGALYVAAANTGSVLAGASEDRADAMEEYARRFSRAFQDRDDLLGAGVVPSAIGGSTQGDIEKGKRTRLYAIAMEHVPAGKRKAFLAAYGRGAKTTAKDVRLVRAALEEYARDAVLRHIEEDVERAVGALRTGQVAEIPRGILESLAYAQLTRRA